MISPNEPTTVRTGIDRIDIASSETAFGGAEFGDVGAYELLTGIGFGVLDPNSPQPSELAYLDFAPHNADGLIEYSMDIAILRPVDPARGNGKILYEVINRGAPLIFEILNRGSLTDPGNGFLMRQGYEIVWAGWQPEANPHTAVYKAYFPKAERQDGAPIVKKTFVSLVPDTPGSGNRQEFEESVLTADITYPAVQTDSVNSNAAVSIRECYTDEPVALKSESVTFLPGQRVAIDLTEASALGFDAGAIVDLTYESSGPWIGGLGFVSTRDLMTHLRQNSVGPNTHTRSEEPVKQIYAWGYSQAGRFLRDFIWQGFNTSTQGGRVFDGVHALVGGARKTDHNLPPERYPFPQTSRWIRQHEDRDYPGFDFPFTYSATHDPLTGRSDSLLQKSSADGTSPKIFQVDSDDEIWNGGAWLLTTAPSGEPLTLPDNVRAFMISGQGHGPGDGTSRDLDEAKFGSNPLDGSPVYRALIVAMDEWVTEGNRPPDTHYPSLQDGTLKALPEAREQWPEMAQCPFSSRMVVPRVSDHSTQPPRFGAAYPVFVPAVDAVGNPLGGVITPDLAAPLGTYMGRNFRDVGHAEGDLCGVPYSGGFIPLASVADHKSHDARPSVDELYPEGEAQYRIERQEAVDKLIARRLVLPDERESYRDSVAFPSLTTPLNRGGVD